MPAKVNQKQHSDFTYRHLLDLNDAKKAYKSPLSVICHIDVNAFFAQYEQIRLNLTDKDPVVCLQWNSLIAVSYAAREYGIGRMDTLQTAKLKCPHLIVAHTAVFKKGESSWKYVQHLPSPTDHKVSLDPYRRASRKMMRIFRSFCDRVEKASVDESFMDFGRLVFRKVMEMLPDILEGLTNVDDTLPTLTQDMVDKIRLDWRGVVIPKPGEEENDEELREISDWDDLLYLIGSELAYEVRQKIVDELGYTTSAGIGRVKTLAKLASGLHKPSQQTIVRNEAIPMFLKKFELTDFWSMGGKTGDFIKGRLDIPYSSQGNEIGYVRNNYTLSELAILFPEDRQIAERLYILIRGEHYDPLEPKISLKSMMSNKNFRGKSVSSSNDLLPWFKVYISDLILRLYDLDEEDETIKRPTKLGIYFNNGTVRHSKQCTIVPIKDLEELRKRLSTQSKQLLKLLEESWIGSPMYPARNCSMTISAFKNAEGNSLIDQFARVSKVPRKKEDSALDHDFDTDESSVASIYESRKKTILVKNKPDILSSLNNMKRLRSEDRETTPEVTAESDPVSEPSSDITHEALLLSFTSSSNAKSFKEEEMVGDFSPAEPTEFICPKCDQPIPLLEKLEHKDFHLALELNSKYNEVYERSYGEMILDRRASGIKKSKGRKNGKKGSISKGQSRLPF